MECDAPGEIGRLRLRFRRQLGEEPPVVDHNGPPGRFVAQQPLRQAKRRRKKRRLAGGLCTARDILPRCAQPVRLGGKRVVGGERNVAAHGQSEFSRRNRRKHRFPVAAHPCGKGARPMDASFGGPYREVTPRKRNAPRDGRPLLAPGVADDLDDQLLALVQAVRPTDQARHGQADLDESHLRRLLDPGHSAEKHGADEALLAHALDLEPDEPPVGIDEGGARFTWRDLDQDVFGRASHRHPKPCRICESSNNGRPTTLL